MFFFSQFETFDPLAGHVPAYPFSYLPEIASRARSILKGKDLSQLVAAAMRIDQEIEWYFQHVKYVAISDLQKKIHSEGDSVETYFEWDGASEVYGGWVFKDEMVDDLEIPTAINSSAVDALKTIIEDRDFVDFLPEGAPEPERDEYEEGKANELFAVLALWLLADALEWSEPDNKTSLSMAGGYAVKAMEAVCYAEHLREIDWAEGYGRRMGEAKLTDALKRQRSEFLKSIRQEKSDQSKELNKRRHARTNHAKEIVTTEWAKDPSLFPSAEKAGIYFADWLVSQNLVPSIEPRTVTGWIRAHAKQKKIKFR